MKSRRMGNLPMKILEKHGRALADHDYGLRIWIPVDIIFHDILTRLPVKSLLRFQCVCKSWCCFLSRNDPSFIDLHLSRSWSRHDDTKLLISAHGSKLRQCLLIVDLEGGKFTQALTVTNEANLSDISENINGLVCWQHVGLTCRIESTYICNPSTREFMKLPKVPQIKSGGCIISAHVSNHFGFVPSSKEFKVLNIQATERDSETVFWIFTLGGNSWRQIYPGLPFTIGVGKLAMWLTYSKKCVCFNGALHWLLGAMKVIVVFGLRDEKFHLILLPVNCRYACAIPNRIVLLHGHLGVLFNIYDNSNFKYKRTEVWTLEDYQNKIWMKDSFTISSIYSCKLWAGIIWPIPKGKILRILNSSSEEDAAMDEHRVLWYDPEQNSFLKVQIPKLDEGWQLDIHGSVSYTETLQPLLSFSAKPPEKLVN
ncbi:unnamed protein product [Ilex paraguariensis]|uniref:F-box domain-containing protein n=1 Tax=Ilex paraguariensis TaxID=185542 RepID=A0ABC8SMW8_9AQUA